MYSFDYGRHGETPVCSEEVLHRIVALLPGKEAAITRLEGTPTAVRAARQEADDLHIMRYAWRGASSHALKIGRSKNVTARQKQSDSGHDFFMDTVAVFKGRGDVEARVHKRLAAHRSCRGSGTEWFDVTVPEALCVIDEIMHQNVQDAPAVEVTQEAQGAASDVPYARLGGGPDGQQLRLPTVHLCTFEPPMHRP